MSQSLERAGDEPNLIVIVAGFTQPLLEQLFFAAERKSDG